MRPRNTISAFVILLAFAVGLAGAGRAAVAADAPNGSSVLSNAHEEEKDMLANLNGVRYVQGLKALKPDWRLMAAARKHATEMANQNFFDHVSPDGETLVDRLDSVGYDFRFAAENIAAGRRNPVDVTSDWMTSENHRVNMLSDKVSQVGVGYVYVGSDPAISRYRHYWVVVFGTERNKKRK